MNSLQDQVAIVTGGAQGIGGATARRLAGEGANVLIADIDEQQAQANAARIAEAGGVAEVIRTDVTRRDDLEAMVERAVSRWDRLDILVNNAWVGGLDIFGPIMELDEAHWDIAMNGLVKANFLAAKYAVPHMSTTSSRTGHFTNIINISSVHGYLAAAGALPYDTAKGAVINLTRQMAVEFGPMGIRVNAICPGHIVTERQQARWDENPALFRFFEAQYPVRRAGKPDDIANAVRFLCSAEASFITGHSLVVDGGLTVQLQEDFAVNMVRYYRDNQDIDLQALP